MQVDNFPNASKLIDSLRFLGYNNISAICDLIDNSLDADANTICVKILYDNNEIKILIIDDGKGMDRASLDQALRLGSISNRQENSDLGKFGMGLVTAGLSIAKRTMVLTSAGGEILKSYSDVDEIKQHNSFTKFLDRASDLEKEFFISSISELNSNSNSQVTGTIVELTKCDNFKSRPTGIANFAYKLREIVGQIYRNFLKIGNKRIFINDVLVEVIDPLMLDEGAESYSSEKIEISFTNSFGVEVTDYLTVDLVIIPDFGDVENKVRKIGQRTQGFYILRNNREIAAGETLKLFTRHNDFNRFRGAISFPGTLDEIMGVNFTKHRIDPTEYILEEISKLVTPQLSSIRRKLKKEKATVLDRDITHTNPEKIIDNKKHLLIVPEDSPVDETEDFQETPGSQNNEGEPGVNTESPMSQLKVKFVSEKMSEGGPIYEAEQIGKQTVIRWNIEHPFYKKFFLERREDHELLNSVDFLVYSLASAELKVQNENNYEIIQNIKTIMSANLRVLLS